MTTMTASHDVWSTPLTPLAFLGRAAEVFPDREAVVYGERRMTYTQFAQEVTRVAHALRACGVKPGDRVAYLLPNIPEMLVAHFAVPLAGGVLVAINTRLAPPEVHYILQHSGATVLVVDAALHRLVKSVLADLPELRHVVTVVDPAGGAQPLPEVRGSTTPSCAPWATTTRCRGRWRTNGRRSRSTTPRARRAARRASCTTTAAPT